MLLLKMCFSSSIICLLVVTCHCSAAHTHLEGEEEFMQLRDTSHVSVNNVSRLASTGVNIQARNYDQKRVDSSHTYELRLVTSRPADDALTGANRKQRSANGQDELLPEPSFQRLSGSHNSHVNHKNDHQHNHTNHHHDAHFDNEDDGYHTDDHHHHEEDVHHHDHDGNERNPDGHSQNSGVKLKKSECNDMHQHSDKSKYGDKHSASAQRDDHSKSSSMSGLVWLYAFIAVSIISMCGLFSVAVIPRMQKRFYEIMLQFLVGMAVGSLSGDGLLHLMPHAILGGKDSHSHSYFEDDPHHHASDNGQNDTSRGAIYRGLAALFGIFFFFLAERILGAYTAYRRNQRENENRTKMVSALKDEGANNGSVGEKLSQPKKNSYDHIKEKDEKETILMLQTEISPSRKGSNQSIHEIGFHGRSSFSLEPEASITFRPDNDSSVIIEHHGHGHGHSHDIPQSVSAVAWMVILGDGLHNFCDGLAIGAAFASGSADGISTTVAVFCHELPHELGDFAMLLKTGMTAKQAIFYNLVSSVLCFVGMVLGIALGNVHSATNWVFAGTAGMFLYIALVDMLPELSSPIDCPGSTAFLTLLIQSLGMFVGVTIMLFIALYEQELHSMLS